MQAWCSADIPSDLIKNCSGIQYSVQCVSFYCPNPAHVSIYVCVRNVLCFLSRGQILKLGTEDRIPVFTA